MKLEIVRMALGPLPNNVYLLGETESRRAVVIDPSFDSHLILSRVESLGWQLEAIWLTHGHFDHFAGAGEIVKAYDQPLSVGLHPADQDWYDQKGGAAQFGMSISEPPPVDLHFEHGMWLSLGHAEKVIEVRHAPGHSPGHVMFYIPTLGVLFCGDVIFRQGIGRTDLAGGDQPTLLKSIQTQVMTLTDETKLLPGHGPDSTVDHERQFNPFL
jgi:glyoxylase-like metal-dependent hydrolase (beta-lactamase superfamily II)